MGWKETIINAHRSVTDCVSHYERLKSDRYFVWQEDGENALEVDNAHKNTAITGTTDLYTKQEFDPWIKAFESALDAFGVSWYLNTVQYEDETGFIHYEWRWEVLDG